MRRRNVITKLEKINENGINNEFGDKNETEKSESSKYQKVGSALFYAFSSILIVFVNKSVLTVYHFPSPQIVGNG